MKIARYVLNDSVCTGVVKDDMVYQMEGDMLSPGPVSETGVPLSDVQLLAPLPFTPPNIICIGLNYAKHADEMGLERPDNPLIFLKATTALTNPGAPIKLPAIAPNEVDYEAELVIVIGKEAKDVPADKVDEYILGYCCGNEVSARDCQLKIDGQWARGKSFDTFAPIGPFVETEFVPGTKRIQSRLNGQVMQDSTLDDLIFDVPTMVSYCSRNMTLLPGTIIMTGTPGGVGNSRNPAVFMRDGDVIEIEIEGLGVLRNPVCK